MVEALADIRLEGITHRTGSLRITDELDESCGDLARGVCSDQEASSTVFNDFWNAAYIRRNDWETREPCFDDCKTKCLALRGVEEEVKGTQVHVSVWDEPREAHLSPEVARVHEPLEPSALLTLSEHDKLGLWMFLAHKPECLKRVLDSLGRVELREHTNPDTALVQ